MVEMMSASLGGFGRAERTDHWGASVFLPCVDPAKFGSAGGVPARKQCARGILPLRKASTRRARAHAG